MPSRRTMIKAGSLVADKAARATLLRLLLARNIPLKVEEYVKDVKKKNPSYDDAQAWATAWSIYCKHKNPDSPHCKQDAYFPGKGKKASLRGSLVRLAHTHPEFRPTLLVLLKQHHS